MRPRTETLCPENISFLKQALESCTTHCHHPAKTSFIPTRLLDIGTDSAAHPRLIITADSINSHEPIQYTAVSYCWGSKADASAQTKTEPSNLYERLRAIPIYDMPALLQDCITVCRTLSVRYLWVDALCTIQDPTDSSGWERESERVGQVYQHAYFTICVLGAHNCHQNFLARSQHTFNFKFQSSLYPAVRGSYILKYTGEPDWDPFQDPITIDCRISRWNDRGWVYQEQELSARKLLFGRHMVHFECGRIEMSENGETCMHLPQNADWAAMNLEQVYGWFREGVQMYSARNLTFESDRLPALAGLARHVSEFTGSKYLAGLWMENLPFGLLWQGEKSKQSLSEHLASFQASSGPTAPSWSWASRPGYIEYIVGLETRYFRPEYTEIDAWTVLKGARLNQFGEVESGTIHIRGCKLLPIPAEFVLSREFTSPFYVTLHEQSANGAPSLGYCSFDWIDASTKLPGKLRMLLLASRCDDDNGEEGDDEEGENEDQDEGGEDNEGGSKRENEVVVGKQEYLVWSRERSSEVEVESPDTVFDYDDLCVFCAGEGRNRQAYGLLVYPAEKIGEYYRVGVFKLCVGKAGGTWLFKELEDECVWII